MMEKIDEMIAVMTAFKNGEKIEYKSVVDGSWNVIFNPEWDWRQYDYRIKEKEIFDSFGTRVVKGDLVWIWDEGQEHLKSLGFLKEYDEKNEEYPYRIRWNKESNAEATGSIIKKYDPNES